MTRMKILLLGSVVLLLLSPPVLAAEPQDCTLSCAFKNEEGQVFKFIDYHLSGGTRFRIDILNADRTTMAFGIYRKDTGTSWSLDPDTKKYSEKKLDPGTWDTVIETLFAREFQAQEKTGEARVLDYPCDVYRQENNRWVTLSYVAQGLNIVLRSEIIRDGKTVEVMEAVKFVQEKPADSLFEIPR